MLVRYAVPVLLATVAATFAVIAPSTHSTAARRAEATSVMVPAPDVERVIRLTGITPEAFAAAGFTGFDCNTLFDSATVYCLQVDRVAEFGARITAANIAMSNAAVDPEKRRPLPNGQAAPEAAVAKAALEELRTTAFEFMTSQLEPNRVATLARIVAAARTWELPVQYLAGSRSDEANLELRAALTTKRSLARRNLPTSDAANGIVASADGDAAVQAANQSLASGLEMVRQSWGQRASSP